MFKELGYKLKFVAYIIYWLCLAALVVLGVFMILQGNLFGYVIGFSSIFLAWIPAAITYAIGEMYEKVMYEGKEVPIFKTKAQKKEEKDASDYEKLKHLQNVQTTPDYDKLKKLKELQQAQAKTKKIKVDDKYKETDI